MHVNLLATCLNHQLNNYNKLATWSIWCKPRKTLSTERITYWIKDLMMRAGIDVSVFKDNLVRGASTTAAESRGVHWRYFAHSWLELRLNYVLVNLQQFVWVGIARRVIIKMTTYICFVPAYVTDFVSVYTFLVFVTGCLIHTETVLVLP